MTTSSSPNSQRPTMKGAIYTSFNSPITISTTLPIPTISSDNHDGALIQIMATGVCRSDWHGWKGHDSDIKNWFDTHHHHHHPNNENTLPFIPGHEASGILIQKGKNVTSFQIGDRVAIPFILSCGTCRECLPPRNQPTICEHQHQPGFTMWGTFAEYCVVSRAERNLRKIPEGVSFVEAAALGCRFGTAFRAVLQQGCLVDSRSSDYSLSLYNNNNNNNNNNNVNKQNISMSSGKEAMIQKTVAIFGCGGLGLSCVAIASAFGAHRIIAVDISRKALKKAMELGATDMIQSDLLHNPQWNDENIVVENKVYRKIMELTSGVGVDLTIDAGGFEQTCLDAIWTCRRGGRFVQVGLPSKQISMPMARIAGREIIIAGSHGFSSVEDSSGISALDKILELVADGKLHPKKLVEREVSLEEGAKALMDMDKGSPLGMVMITDFGRGETKSKL